MADNSGTQQLFDMWKKQVDEGTQAWLKMAGQGQAPDPAGFLAAVHGSGHAGLVEGHDPGHGLAGPDGAVEAVPRSVDRRVVEGARAGHGHGELRPGHGQAARGLPQCLRAGEEGGRAADRIGTGHHGPPSRSQVIGLAEQIAGLEDKIESVEDRIDAVLARLDSLAVASKKERE